VIRFGHPHRGVLKKKMDDGGVLHGHNSEILPGVASSKSKCVKLKSIRPGCVRLPNAPIMNERLLPPQTIRQPGSLQRIWILEGHEIGMQHAIF